MKMYFISFIAVFTLSLATVHDVDIVSGAFSPSSLTISQGDTVLWTNQANNSHTTTSDTGVWDSGTLTSGQVFSFTFNDIGSYDYHCDIHASMTANVTVETELKLNEPSNKFFNLNAIYPNPFNPSTTISWNQEIPSYVIINIYNLKGTLIECLSFGMLSIGYHQIQWAPKNITSGIYLIELSGQNFSQVQKVVYTK